MIYFKWVFTHINLDCSHCCVQKSVFNQLWLVMCNTPKNIDIIFFNTNIVLNFNILITYINTNHMVNICCSFQYVKIIYSFLMCDYTITIEIKSSSVQFSHFKKGLPFFKAFITNSIQYANIGYPYSQ